MVSTCLFEVANKSLSILVQSKLSLCLLIVVVAWIALIVIPPCDNRYYPSPSDDDSYDEGDSDVDCDHDSDGYDDYDGDYDFGDAEQDGDNDYYPAV